VTGLYVRLRFPNEEFCRQAGNGGDGKSGASAAWNSGERNPCLTTMECQSDSSRDVVSSKRLAKSRGLQSGSEVIGAQSLTLSSLSRLGIQKTRRFKYPSRLHGFAIGNSNMTPNAAGEKLQKERSLTGGSSGMPDIKGIRSKPAKGEM